MQSKEIISRWKVSFRELRKGKEKQKNDLVQESGISWSTINKVLPDLVSVGALKESQGNKLVINPEYEYFAGIYISQNIVELSMIDFSGKEKLFRTKVFSDQQTYVDALIEILKINHIKNIKAVSICADDYFGYMGAEVFYLPTNSNQMKGLFVPEWQELYFAKTCETNALKWYEETGNSELNVIFSFSEDKTYYTIMKNGFIIQNRRYCESIKNVKNFYTDVILPVWKAINPSNMVFVASSEEILNIINENIEEWQKHIGIHQLIINKEFELREPTKLIATEYSRPSESAALYALYSYYGWIN